MSIHTATMKGRRKTNEDAHIVKTYLNRNNNSKKDYAKVNIYGVFDGHGGPYVSKYLYNNLHKYFISSQVKYPVKKSYINKVYDRLQEKLTAENKVKSYGCGSTCLVALHFKDINHKDRLQIMNTGDSRAIICRKDMAIRLTNDHKPNNPFETHRITELGGKIRYDGYDYRIKDLSVSRAFGDNDSKPYVVHNPDIFDHKIDKNDKFMVLACDGLWDVMTDQDVVDYVLSEYYNIESGQRIKKRINVAKKLADHAIGKLKSSDNVTVLVVFFNKQ